MPLTGLKLYGSTVKAFNTGLGWGTNKSNVRVSLVEDVSLGDYFLPPPVGTPTYVTFDSLNFWGLLQKWERGASPEGMPVYEVYIEDPRDILDGTALILDNYNGSTAGVPNLLNPFGYWENELGFGGAQTNESGMPWNLIASAVTTLTQNTPTIYGGPLQYKGWSYAVDLSQLPVPPSYYRLGGTGVTLLGAIQQICEDGGMDFFVDMIPNTTIIRVRTTSRVLSQPVGYLSDFIAAAQLSGTLINSNVGLEARNETTSSFLVGGELTSIYEAQPASIMPYFGKDTNNNPIIGVQTIPGNPFSLTAVLNCSEIADITGSSGYVCNATEMCCALADMNSWLNYVSVNKPGLSALIGLIPPNVPPIVNGVLQPVLPQDVLNLQALAVADAAQANVQDYQHFITQRVYNFVLKNAQEYLGKKFLVEMPFILSKTEAETGRILYDYSVTDAAYKEDGSPPLGLNSGYKDNFQNGDDRYRAMSLYSNLTNTDLSRVISTEYVIDVFSGNGIYVSTQVDDEIIFLDALTPCVVATVSNGLYEPPLDGTGAGLAEVAAVLQMDPADCQRIMEMLPAGNFFSKMSPIPRQPDYIAIPLKSNVLRYGPWFAVGAWGKVNYQYDESLVPWNYGGSTVMNLAAQARVQQAITFQQQVESGAIQLVGAPILNIGDQLDVFGPNVTNMEVGWGANGVTTNYRFQTFSNRFGVFNKDNVERLKKMGLQSQQLKQNIRLAFKKKLIPTSITNANLSFLGSQALKTWPGQFQRGSPHAYMGGMVVPDLNNPGLYRTAVTTISDNELAPSIPAHDSDLYQKTAVMSLSGLIRPFSTKYGDSYMASYEVPNANYNAGVVNTFYNPFKSGNDIDIYIRGTGYTDAHAYINSGPSGDIRGCVLRGPLVVTGWGWSTDDAFVPNASGDALNGGPLTDYLRKSKNWKTGAVDLLWDNERKVWTPHGFMIGKTTDIINGGSEGTVKLWDDDGELIGRAKDRTVFNFFSSAVPSGVKIMAAWVPEANKWCITAADCV